MVKKKNKAAMALVKLRMAKTTPEQRQAAARKAGKARMKQMTKAERRALGKLGAQAKHNTKQEPPV